MAQPSGALVWGATIDGECGRDRLPTSWSVQFESEPLGSLVVDSALPRFAHDAKRLAPHASPDCSLELGRFRLALQIDAPGPDEAAATGEHVYLRALETALWPRVDVAGSAGYTVTVSAAAADAAAEDAIGTAR